MDTRIYRQSDSNVSNDGGNRKSRMLLGASKDSVSDRFLFSFFEEKNHNVSDVR